MGEPLVAPFPFYGGKRRVVELVWPALGPGVNSYVEPFAGSLAVLLGRPGGAGKYETVNDISGAISNFFRAVQADPEAVAYYADGPVIEQDLHGRHQYLVDVLPSLTEALIADPHHYDPKIAGWWVWGQSCWIGDGWCRHPEWRARPDLTGRNSVHALARKRPGLTDYSAKRLRRQLPDIAGRRGVHRKAPDLHGRKGIHATESAIVSELVALAERLRPVRVCCGDFERVLSTATLGLNPSGHAQGIAPAGIFFDPPYPGHEDIYGSAEGVSERVFRWCMEHGDEPGLRIVVAGYEGDYAFPASWRMVAWKAHGGYALQGDGSNQNAHRERLWLSPHTLDRAERQFALGELFGC
jgi:hypothetical protein